MMIQDKKIELLSSAKKELEYMRMCAYTNRVPADSEELINTIKGLGEMIEGAAPSNAETQRASDAPISA
jgi:hypothetical protein